MRCTRPVLERTKTGPVEVVERPCGVCPACRATKAQNWTYRLYCESKLHKKSMFITLTYDDEHLKQLKRSSQGYYSLSKKELQNFMKLFRKNLSRRIRFYGVGEYGSKQNTHRPHFHIIVFGADMEDEPIVRRSWSKGFVKCGSVTPSSIAYVARYCTKKLLDDGVDDPELLPEFNLQSNRPGIGFGAIDKAVNRSDDGNLYCWYQGKRVGLPKYFKDKVRTAYESYVARVQSQVKRDDRYRTHTEKELFESARQSELNTLSARRTRKKL